MAKKLQRESTTFEKEGLILDTATGDVTHAEESFFQKRMKEAGVDASNLIFKRPFYDLPQHSDDFRTWPILDYRDIARYEEDEHGNVIIKYFDLKGIEYEYKGDAKWGKDFTRVRLKNPTENAKYLSPRKSGNYPFFHPNIIAKCRDKEEIKTLVITEGEFKAERACNAGIDVIGISGIHNFYCNDETKRKLHEDIIEVIKACKVKRLLFLTDADTLSLKFRPEKDLSERPNQFYTAIKNFREAALNLIETEHTSLTDVYFGHIKLNFNDIGQKGLDDLINKQMNGGEGVKRALNELTFDSTYFDILQVTDGLFKIQEHFGLKDINNFYGKYDKFIGNQEFIFKKRTYQYSTEAEKIIEITHDDKQLFMRVECDWFKIVHIPNRHNELEEEIKKWNVAEITRDYGKIMLDYIPKYDTWCNVPSMNGTYKRVHNNCFNLFNPLKHEPKEGSIENTLFFIKHLFGGEATVENEILGDTFTVALDYLTLMYQKPDQILPVPCLVSPENGTGKSTFLKWLKDIYGSNATIIDNERFKQNFNSHYITKYIIGIDEGFLDVDKRAEKERLKKLATDEKQYLEFKGSNVFEIDFYGKIIICSNDADSLMKMEEGEIRWFVIKVPTFASRGYPEDPDFRMKLKNEIPAWLHFLKNRKVFHPKEGRAWFNPEYIITDQMREVVENTRNYLERMVDEYLEEMFLLYNLQELTMPLDYMVDQINRQAKHKLDKLQVKKYIEKKRSIKKEPLPGHIRIPTGFADDKTLTFHAGTYRYYVLKRADWVTQKAEALLKQGEEVAVFPSPKNEPTPLKETIQGQIVFNLDDIPDPDEETPF